MKKIDKMRKSYPGYEIKPVCDFANLGYIVTNMATGRWQEFGALYHAEKIMEAETITWKSYLANERPGR